MIKTTLFLCLLVASSTICAKAQTPVEAEYNRYLAFKLSRLSGDVVDALAKGEAVLPKASLLPPKTRAIFYDGLAKAYEDNNRPLDAISYYQQVTNAEPNYYPAHRALGYALLLPAKEFYTKMNAATPEKAPALALKYKNAVLKALPHLEKAQACAPTTETLDLIKTLYTNIKDDQGLASLDARLSTLSKDCVSFLSE